MRFILLIGMLVASGTAFAQSKREKRKKADDADLPMQQPNSIDPNNLPTEPKQKKIKSSVKPSRNPEQEFYERMAEVEKTRRKNERMMDKPQYSDPMYFGHKKPPKKRKPSKMKYCKVCGIRH